MKVFGRSLYFYVLVLIALLTTTFLIRAFLGKKETTPPTTRSVGESAFASVDGKYSKLIQVLKCPNDKERNGEFTDYGYWEGGQWCGQTAEAGYWVWVPPNWYVWENKNK